MTDTFTTHTDDGKQPGKPPRVKRMESRDQIFVRLSLARMARLQRQVKLICNLPAYTHSEAQAAKIVEEMQRLTRQVETAFALHKHSDTFTF